MSGAETYDVAVVGAGIEGLSVAYQLAVRSSLRVVVVDRDAVGSGGTGKSSGVVRCHYGVDSLAAMAWFGVRFLETAIERLGTEVGFHQTGYVVIVGGVDSAALDANVARLQALGIDTERLGVDAASEMLPHVNLDDVAGAAWEPRGGYGDAYRTAQGFAAVARDRRVTIHQFRPVTRLRVAHGRMVGIDTATGPIDAPVVVVAAGAWSRALLAGVGVDLPVRSQREELLVISPGQPLHPSPVLSDLVSLQYVRTEPTDDLLVGNSDHHDPEIVDPDHYSNRVDADGVARAVDRIAHRMPRLADPRVVTGYAGTYDITPDYNPVIDATPGIDGLVVCAGFSGHGFKIAPAVGALVADQLLGESTLPDEVRVEDFRLGRFAEGRLLVSAAPYAGAGQMR